MTWSETNTMGVRRGLRCEHQASQKNKSLELHAINNTSGGDPHDDHQEAFYIRSKELVVSM